MQSTNVALHTRLGHLADARANCQSFSGGVFQIFASNSCTHPALVDERQRHRHHLEDNVFYRHGAYQSNVNSNTSLRFCSIDHTLLPGNPTRRLISTFFLFPLRRRLFTKTRKLPFMHNENKHIYHSIFLQIIGNIRRQHWRRSTVDAPLITRTIVEKAESHVHRPINKANERKRRIAMLNAQIMRKVLSLTWYYYKIK